MIKQYIQNLSAPAARVHGQTAGPGFVLPGGDAKPFANTLRRLREMLDGIDRKRRAAYENRKAIAHLQSLTDAQLRDIGIHRHEIEHRVSQGRDSI